MKSFSQFLATKQESHVVLTFGRFQPPTLGHEKLIAKVHEIANHYHAPHHIVLSHTHGGDKNPLDPETKLKYAKLFFPESNIELSDKSCPGIVQLAARIQGNHTHLHVVAGDDRVDEYQILLDRYNGKNYQYESITVHSSGERNPESEHRIRGLSASKLRQYAIEGNRRDFEKGLPSLGYEADLELYHDVRRGLGLHENNGKALFLVGGPGSGKDIILRPLLPFVTEISPDNIGKDRTQLLLENHTPVVINGQFKTWEDALCIKGDLEAWDYETKMVYVYTTDEESRRRNEARKWNGRVINEATRHEKYLTSINMIGDYKEIFKDDFHLLDNSNHPDINPLIDSLMEFFGPQEKKPVDINVAIQEVFMPELFGQGYPIVPDDDDPVKEKDVSWKDVVRARKKGKKLGSATTSINTRNGEGGSGLGLVWTGRGDGSSFPLSGLAAAYEEIDAVLPNYGNSGASHMEPMATQGEKVTADLPSEPSKKKKNFKNFRKGELDKRIMG